MAAPAVSASISSTGLGLANTARHLYLASPKIIANPWGEAILAASASVILSTTPSTTLETSVERLGSSILQNRISSGPKADWRSLYYNTPGSKGLGSTWTGNTGEKLNPITATMPRSAPPFSGQTRGFFIPGLAGDAFKPSQTTPILFTSGTANLWPNYRNGNHVEALGAGHMNQNFIPFGTMLIDHPKGICMGCNNMLPTQLDFGRQLLVVPLPDTPKVKFWHNTPKLYIGNDNGIKPPPPPKDEKQ